MKRGTHVGDAIGVAGGVNRHGHELAGGSAEHPVVHVVRDSLGCREGRRQLAGGDDGWGGDQVISVWFDDGKELTRIVSERQREGVRKKGAGCQCRQVSGSVPAPRFWMHGMNSLVYHASSLIFSLADAPAKNRSNEVR